MTRTFILAAAAALLSSPAIAQPPPPPPQQQLYVGSESGPVSRPSSGPGSGASAGVSIVTQAGAGFKFTALTISGCCSIDNTGKVTLAAGVPLDEASRKFWDTVSVMGMNNCKPPQEGTTP
jgi:hypothetical protein